MTYIDASASITTHAALTQNVHGVGANDIADVADISTHAAVTTNVHGTGAGNVIVGDDELTTTNILRFSYTGNGTLNRAIAHGLSIKPKFYVIGLSDGASSENNIVTGENGDGINIKHGTATAAFNNTTPDATNIYVGYDGTGIYGNINSKVYECVVFV